MACGRLKRLGRGQPAKYEQLWAEHVPLINDRSITSNGNGRTKVMEAPLGIANRQTDFVIALYIYNMNTVISTYVCLCVYS